MGEVARKMGLDPATGLALYDSFLQDLSDKLVMKGAKETDISIVLLDIDWFGKVNKAHGPTIGDEAIACLGEHLVSSLDGSGTVYRYGGDAFMVLFDGLDKEEAFLQMEGARRTFEGNHRLGAAGETVEVSLTISGGVAAYPDDGSEVPMLVRKCNEALYRAKVRGRNKICIAREEKMVTKTTHYTQGQLEGLSRLAKREGVNEAALLREAIDDLLRKHNS